MNLQSENSMGLAIQIATFICCWDKEFSYEEITVLLDEINSWSELEEAWDHKLHRDLTCALHDALDCIVGLSNEDLNAFIAESAARMTNHQGRETTLRLAYKAAAADGLDDDEVDGLMHFGSHHWGMTRDQVAQAAIPDDEPVAASTTEPAPDDHPPRTYEDSVQQTLNAFLDLEEGFFNYSFSVAQGIYAQGSGSPAHGDEDFELEITGPEYSADPDRVFAGNVEAQLQELGWQAYEGENFKCTVSRDGLKDGSVAALLCRSFYVYNLHESEIDGPKITVSEA